MKKFKMPSINHIVVTGRLLDDRVVETTRNGKEVVKFSIAVPNYYKDHNGEWVDDPQMVRCVAYGNSAKTLGKYGSKGSPFLIEGSLETYSFIPEGEEKRVYMFHIKVNKAQKMTKEEEYSN